MNTGAATAFWTIVGLGGLLFLLHSYTRYRVDLFRDRMFTVRDDLFDLAASGEIGFNDRAYCLLRTTLNGYIRFGDRVGFAAVVGAALLNRERHQSVKGFDSMLQEALEPHTDHQRKQIHGIVTAMNFAVADQVIFGSPLLLATVLPLILAFALKYAGQHAIKQLIRKVDSLALVYGENLSTA